jgi:hypothetical protein
MSAQIRWSKLFQMGVSLLLLIAMTVLAACSSVVEEGAQVEPAPTETVQVPPQVETASPVEVTESFFNWYVETVESVWRGEREGSTVGLYHESSALTPALVAKLDANSGQGADPVLHAQDLPQEMQFETWDMEGDTACVIVYQAWGSGYSVALTVDLIREGEQWLLDDIRRGTPRTPDGTTQLFYSWYLGYIGQGETHRNPLVDGAYRQSELLSPAFIEKVDGILAGPEGGRYDPILLAQDVPVGIEIVEVVEVVEGGEEATSATVTVHRTFGGNPQAYPMLVHLERQGHGWQIVDVTDPGMGKAGCALDAAEGFYGWYLGYIGDPASDTFRNPLVDRAYRQAPFVSEAFVAEIDALLDQDIEEFGGIMGDPILQAQAIPSGFEVQPGPAEDIVTVNLFFGETVSPVQVRVVQEGEHWLVDGIIPRGSTLPVDGAAAREVDTSGWQTIANETFGFSFLLPPDWVADPMDLEGSGIPEDWPVPAGYALMPVEVAEALAAVAGSPPDPNTPMQILFLLEVVEGDQAAFDRVYVQPVESTTTVINDNAVRVERDHEEYTVVRYVFEHPTREGVWVVLNDALSEFPGREEQAAAVADILPGILNSFSFR